MFENLRNASAERLDCTFLAASSKRRPPLVVIGHGVTANKDRPWAVALANALSEAGFASLRFSFSGNGDSEGDFRASTITKEVGDLESVLDAVEEGPLCYVGHSMGAAVGVIGAARDRRIESLVSLAGMVHTADFARRKFGELTPGRDVMWDKPECPLSQAFVDDMRRIGSVLPLAAQVRVPWLVVHGTADTVVPHAESEQICSAAGAETRMVSLPDADHLFAGQERRMAATVVDWLAER